MSERNRHPLRSGARTVMTLATALVLVLLPGPRADAANSIWLSFCDAAPNHSVEGFAAIQDRGLLTRRDCREVGKTEEGLMTRTARDTVKGPRRLAVRYREVAGLVFRAPPGTLIKSVRWGGDARRRSCDWLAQLRIVDENQPSVKNELLAGHRRDQARCQDREPLDPARARRIRTYNILGNPRYDVPRPKVLAQRVICVNRHGCPLADKPQAYIVTQSLRIEIVDAQPPSQLALTGGDAFSGWINSDRTLTFSASDIGSGVKVVRAVNDAGAVIGSAARSCLFTRPVPCPNGPGSLSLSVRAARQGTQAIALQAFDAADNTTGLVPVGQIRVDTVAPGAAPVSVDGGEGWRNTPIRTLRWSNADNAGDVAPITGVRYRICPTGTRCDATPIGSSSTDQLTLDAPPGESDVTVWRMDGAGNENPANASVPVTLRYDPEPPKATFDPLDPTDPTRLSAAVSDRYSGVAAGHVELSQQGSGVWLALPTQLQGTSLVARVDDSRLAPGAYSARVVVSDGAGNTTVSDQAANGQPMVLRLPLRIGSRLSGGVASKRIVKRSVRRHGRRRVIRRAVTVYRAGATTRLGRKVRIGGRLANSDGHPIAGADVYVYSTPQGGTEQLVAAVRTDSAGRYDYTLRADRNRTLRLVYAGTQLIQPAERHVAIAVAATSSFHVSRHRVPNGGAVVFSGRVRSLPVPPTGKIVELQWRVGGADWGTFRTVRTDGNGRWRLRYRFSRIRSTVRLAFRAHVPAEGGYPFVTGGTRAVRITVSARE